MPSWGAELVRPHDLGADSRSEPLRERVINPAAAAGLADHPVPPLRGEHPFVQPFAGVAERCLLSLTLTGAETVKRDGEVVDTGE
jgi:hypothetical protein